jgi:hypothetical protein
MKGSPMTSHAVDQLLCQANEAQLRNVLAVVSRSIPDAELIAEAAMSAVEAFDESLT